MDRLYWRAFNVLVRLFALLFILGGLVGLALGAPRLGLFCVALGVALATVRAYRPDLGDVERLIAPREFAGRSLSPRSWWTGDRKAGGRPDA